MKVMEVLEEKEPMTEALEGVLIGKREADQPTEVFTINSDSAAEWLLKKLANLQAEKARVQVQAEQILMQLDADAQRLHYLYDVPLETYCRSKIEAGGGRRRSVTFLQGTCAFRKVPAGLKITDLDAALQHAQSILPTAVRSVTSLDRTAYRDLALQALEETGELLPGVEATPEHETFTLRFP